MSLPPLSPYTFGAMSLGSDPDLLDQHVQVACRAIEAGLSIHASPTYHRGFSFMVLRLALDQMRSFRPPVIIKIRDGSPTLLRFETEDTCRRLGLDRIDVAQLVAMHDGPHGIAADLASGGPLATELASLKTRGLIRSTVLFLTPDQPGALPRAWPGGLLDGATLYWNALQRACSDDDYAFILKNQIPLLALRTLAGGPGQDSPSSVSPEELITQTGSADWTDLNLRLAHHHPNILTTIGGTASLAHLEHFIAQATSPRALTPADQALFPHLFPNS